MNELATAENNLSDGFGQGSVLDLIESHRDSQWEQLDPALRLFSFAYLEQYDHTDAAIKAGIPKAHALKTLRNPLVQAFTQDILEDRQIATTITQDFVTSMWMKLLPKLMGDEEVPLITSSGAVINEKKFFASESIGALREMSKSTKFYEQGSGGTNLNLSIAISAEMSPAEASQEYMRMVKGEVL